jgi:thiol-disulfide isomerase/thioredoxin
MNKIIFYIKSNFFVKILLMACLILAILVGGLFFLSENGTSYEVENLKSQGYLSDDIGIEFHQFNLTRIDSGTLFSDQKKLLASDDLVNRPYLLNFWATWCGPCRAEFDDLESLWKENNLVVVGVNQGENRNLVEEFIMTYEPTFEIVLDLDLNLSSTYNIRGIPVTFLIYNDKVYDKWIGPISKGRVQTTIATLEESGIIK